MKEIWFGSIVKNVNQIVCYCYLWTVNNICLSLTDIRMFWPGCFIDATIFEATLLIAILNSTPQYCYEYYHQYYWSSRKNLQRFGNSLSLVIYGKAVLKNYIKQLWWNVSEYEKCVYFFVAVMTSELSRLLPSWYLLVQSQQWKHQDNL